MNAKTALKYAEEQGAKFLSLRFTDLVGAWHHLSYPIHELGEGSFEDGFGFDASSLRGWASIHESDMLLVPDPARMWMDPFAEESTLCLIANAVDPITKEGYGLDPRSVAQRAESYLRFTGLADTVYFGPEAEFFVFDGVRFNNDQFSAGYTIESDEGHWASGRATDASGPNQGYRIRPKEGYVPVPPTDTLSDLRSEISLILERCGITVECHHHEVATAGQCEIDIRYATMLGT
ncbi:MAG TPA: glutamine synthetase beta-grasp domain-containing protein, partial [Pyrinomonadaceae bacterium]